MLRVTYCSTLDTSNYWGVTGDVAQVFDLYVLPGSPLSLNNVIGGCSKRFYCFIRAFVPGNFKVQNSAVELSVLPLLLELCSSVPDVLILCSLLRPTLSRCSIFALSQMSNGVINSLIIMFQCQIYLKRLCWSLILWSTLRNTEHISF